MNDLATKSVQLSTLEKFFLRIYCYPPPGRTVLDNMSEEFDSRKDPLITLKKYYGPLFFDHIHGKTILDIGCGHGDQVVALASQDTRKVIGSDIRDNQHEAKAHAKELGVESKAIFTCNPVTELGEESIDIAYCLNSFEHFSEPEKMLKEINYTLKRDGKLFITFGPPWLAPYGLHMYFMIRYPWPHILFPEKTILNVRKLYRSDGANHYEEVEGGLNKMTYRKFKKLLTESNFQIEYIELVPTKGVKWLTKIPFIREFFTTHITAILRKTS